MIRKLVLVASILVSSAVMAEESKSLPPQTLFKNVHVWDGTSKRLSKSTNVLIEGNLIKKVGAADTEANARATVIDGKGMTLMPGLIESHVHLNLRCLPSTAFLQDSAPAHASNRHPGRRHIQAHLYQRRLSRSCSSPRSGDFSKSSS